MMRYSTVSIHYLTRTIPLRSSNGAMKYTKSAVKMDGNGAPQRFAAWGEGGSPKLGNNGSFCSVPSSSLGPHALEALASAAPTGSRSFPPRVPKPELGNERFLGALDRAHPGHPRGRYGMPGGGKSIQRRLFLRCCFPILDDRFFLPDSA
jgi:hypothetical protein